MASNVSAVYIHVLDDVINKVRDEFINYGVGEGVLNELQALWEMKMRQCGAISGNIERSALPKNAPPITPVHDLNVPYEGPAEEYETPTAEMLFPPLMMKDVRSLIEGLLVNTRLRLVAVDFERHRPLPGGISLAVASKKKKEKEEEEEGESHDTLPSNDEAAARLLLRRVLHRRLETSAAFVFAERHR
ncbi:hypothetical protein GW17_00009913 [Ensete ventricosum]|nr:hypothetical protein GW17_00009913 [Ensete ventricosum]